MTEVLGESKDKPLKQNCTQHREKKSKPWPAGEGCKGITSTTCYVVGRIIKIQRAEEGWSLSFPLLRATDQPRSKSIGRSGEIQREETTPGKKKTQTEHGKIRPGWVCRGGFTHQEIKGCDRRCHKRRLLTLMSRGGLDLASIVLHRKGCQKNEKARDRGIPMKKNWISGGRKDDRDQTFRRIEPLFGVKGGLKCWGAGFGRVNYILKAHQTGGV